MLIRPKNRLLILNSCKASYARSERTSPIPSPDINNAFRKAAESGPLAGILGYSEENLVSSDIIDDPRSGIVHALSTLIVQERMAKIQVWYDNEFGYSRRLFEVASKLPL